MVDRRCAYKIRTLQGRGGRFGPKRGGPASKLVFENQEAMQEPRQQCTPSNVFLSKKLTLARLGSVRLRSLGISLPPRSPLLLVFTPPPPPPAHLLPSPASLSAPRPSSSPSPRSSHLHAPFDPSLASFGHSFTYPRRIFNFSLSLSLTHTHTEVFFPFPCKLSIALVLAACCV